MATRRKKDYSGLAAVVALFGLALAGLTFTNVPIIAGAATIVGVIIALPATAYLCVVVWRRLHSS